MMAISGKVHLIHTAIYSSSLLDLRIRSTYNHKVSFEALSPKPERSLGCDASQVP